MPRIDRKTIDQIYQVVDIVDVVGDFVTLRKAGANYKGLCPFHDEKTPSFVVTPSKGICHCFGCHKGGNAVNFLMELNNWTYPETMRWLAKRYNIDIIETEVSEKAQQEQKHREELFSINQWANDYFKSTLHNTDEGKGVGMTYFRSRGFRDDIISKFELGYCPSTRRALFEAAQANHLNTDNLVETGLCIKPENGRAYDRFHGRVMFPVHNQMGKIVAFGGRILEKRENVGKYVNSPESIIYSKSRELYGLFLARQAIQRQGCCYMVEGYTDVISMHQCGIENVVASSGTALTHDQIRLIKKYTTNITVLYDGDNAGIKASLRGIDMFLEHGLNVKVLLLPDGDDPDSFARKHSAEEYVTYINEHQVDFIKFKTDLLLKDAGTDVHTRSEVINNIAESIAKVDDHITRSLYIQQCSSITGVREEDLIEAVNAIRNRLNLAKLQERQKREQANATSQTQTTGNVPTQTFAIPKRSAKDIAEFNMMKYVIRFGELPIGDIEEADGTVRKMSFADYIEASLNADEIILNTPFYTTIITEIVENQDIPNFKAISYLLTHPEEDIRNFALKISTDRDFTIAVNETSITSNLNETADKLLTDLSIAILEDKINECNRAISSGTLTNAEIETKIREIQSYKQAQNMYKN